MFYIVHSNQGTAENIYFDRNTSLQLGDYETYTYVNQNGDLVVRNCGDVSSVVWIKNVHTKKAKNIIKHSPFTKIIGNDVLSKIIMNLYF